MSLIDREKLMESLGTSVECTECQYHDQWLCNKSADWVECCEAIADAPTVDAVPVVRCKDCKHSHPWYADRRTCVMWSETGESVFNDDYCSRGERKE